MDAFYGQGADVAEAGGPDKQVEPLVVFEKVQGIDVEGDHVALGERFVDDVFKEARLTHSIVFFDECDHLFKSDTYDSRILLIEIEKADSITILATNRTLKLDPALDRRIQRKVRLDLPGATERERIWGSLMPQGVRLDPDVDFGTLARKFHFSEGLIKNALLAAIEISISCSARWHKSQFRDAGDAGTVNAHLIIDIFLEHFF